MKQLLIFSLLSLTSVEAGETQDAIHSPFTINQISEHLGLRGGNWEISFDQKCFLGFIITRTSSGGNVSKDYRWSSTASKDHKFHYMHHVESSSERDDTHQISYSSYQIGEIEKKGPMSSSISIGVGVTCNVTLPRNGEQRFMVNSIKPKLDEPTLLYSWTSEQTKEAFRLDVIFSNDIKRAEQAADGKTPEAPQPPH